jgi:hypothetical protein
MTYDIESRVLTAQATAVVRDSVPAERILESPCSDTPRTREPRRFDPPESHSINKPRFQPGFTQVRPHGPETGQERILDVATTRIATGAAYRQYQPLIQRGNNDIGEGLDDDPLWQVPRISAYVKEASDETTLEEPVLPTARRRSTTGNGDRSFDDYRRVNRSVRESISEGHRCEPYVYAQMITGRELPTHGEAKNSWLTGTAAWIFGDDGVDPGHPPGAGDLRADPCCRRGTPGTVVRVEAVVEVPHVVGSGHGS